jgi:hypothetical protein
MTDNVTERLLPSQEYNSFRPSFRPIHLAEFNDDYNLIITLNKGLLVKQPM